MLLCLFEFASGCSCGSLSGITLVEIEPALAAMFTSDPLAGHNKCERFLSQYQGPEGIPGMFSAGFMAFRGIVWKEVAPEQEFTIESSPLYSGGTVGDLLTASFVVILDGIRASENHLRSTPI